VYDPEGDILFTTVSLRGDVNVYEALQGWLDDEIEVVPEERITGGQPKDQVRQINIEAMDTSKLTATKVALERLGYRVDLDGKGAVVTQVLEGSPADGRLQVGDVILAVDGEAVGLNDQAVAMVRAHKAGDTINLRFRRGRAEQELSLVAGDAGDEAHSARIGVVLGQTLEATYKFPVAVSIDTGEVGGPSAGLAFTLALIDELTPGELTGGRPVAVTGTIDINGNVGLVGGVPQKTVTARKAGAVAFLVPPDEAAEAKEYAGRMRIVPVKDLNDALAALEDLGGSGLALPSAPPGS
jgi:PDZ domain-containing protein